MLSDREQQQLKQLIRDNTPMSVVKPGQSLADPIPGITETVLRRLIRDNSPMETVNPGAHATMRESIPAHISRADEEILEKAPKLQPVDMNDDYAVVNKLARIENDLKPGDVYTLGITRAQIAALSLTDLKQLIEVRRKDRIEEGFGNFPLHGDASAAAPLPVLTQV
jgi:hypothetical protein